MTVSTDISRSGPYAGAGTTGPFTVNFRFLANSHLQVIRTASGVDTTLVLDTDYTVSGAGGSSGTVTLATALAVGQSLTIIRDVPFTQLADYVAGDSFPAQSHEDALDLLVMQTQQLKDGLDRSLTLAPTAVGASTELPAPQSLALIGWDTAGTALKNYDANSLGVAIATASWRTDVFNGTGAQTAFILTQDAGVASNCDVSVSGVQQVADVNFSYNSTTKTITFLTGAPAAGTGNVAVRYGSALAAGTLASTSITDSTVTGRSVLTAASAAAARTAIGAQATLGYTAADDTAVVKLTGAQTIAGVKTFSSQPVLPQAPVLGTAVNTTSGTAIDFTGIPSWVKRITVSFRGVSTNGTSLIQVQLGAGSVQTTGYLSQGGLVSSVAGTAGSTTGMLLSAQASAADTKSGQMVLTHLGSNVWASSCVVGVNGSSMGIAGGDVALGGTLDRIRLTTVGGTDTFDAGSVNIYYEG